MNFIKKVANNLVDELDDGFQASDVSNAIINSCDGTTQEEKKKNLVKGCKNLAKNLFKGMKSVAFQLRDISSDVVKTLDGGQHGEEPYEDPDGPAELNPEVKEIKGEEIQLHQDVEFCASRPEKVLGGEHGEDAEIEWLRPHEIIDDPQLYSGGGSQFDVVQGRLGDCWLLAAMASVSMNRKLIARVCPENQTFEPSDGYTGKFIFRLFQYGDWVEVEIDDRLPCKNGELLYTKSQTNNEFWSALLEKAYAKVNGSYKNLHLGHASEAMTDLTGGVCELIEWKKHELNKNFLMKKYREISSAIADGAICTTGIQNSGEARRDDGLIAGHAYSVIDAKTVEINGRRFHLLKLRNPWGQVEWNGDFSDQSDLQVPDHEEDEDGEFWMTAPDWITRFTKMEICRLSTDDFNRNGHWHEESFHGKWCNEEGTAGGCRNHENTFCDNPYQIVSLSGGNESNQILVSLQQKHRRKQKAEGKGLLLIGFQVYRVVNLDGGSLAELINWPDSEMVYGCNFNNRRDCTAKFQVSNSSGEYAIVPSTFAPGEEAHFYMRIYTEQETPENEIEEFEDDEFDL